MTQEKVLVVDDELVVLDLCRRILEGEGYRVVTASNGWEGIRQVREQPFDVVLTDIKMPGLDGLEAIEIMRESRPNLVCVVMTGFSTMDLAIQAVRLGVDEFVVKPFTPDELSRAVARAVEKVRLRDENVRLQAIVPLFELSQTFLRTVEPGPLMQQVVDVAIRETGADRVVLLARASLDDPHLVVQAATGYSVEAASLSGEPFVVEGLLADAAQQQISAREEAPEPWQAALKTLEMASAIVTPLAVKEGILGALVVGWEAPTEDFGLVHPEFLAVLGGQAAIAIHNARLFEEIRRAYRELQVLDRMKSDFINVAAHELRTPIAILMGYAGLLQEEAPDDVQEPLQVMARNAERLSSLVDDLLDLDRLQAGAALLSVSEFAPAGVVQDVVADFRPLAEGHEIRVEADVAEGLPLLRTDRQKLELVIANLVSNAVKFTPAGGRVMVRARAGEGGQGLVVEVEDTGVGIDPDEQQKIFEPFYQVGNSLTRKHEGMGLGLSIVRGLLDLMGGSVEVESEVGQGSTFRVILPPEAPEERDWRTAVFKSKADPSLSPYPSRR